MSGRLKVNAAIFILGIMIPSLFGFAQGTPATQNSPEKKLFKDILDDQRVIWTSPAHVKRHDLKWLAPFVGISASLIATDNRVSNKLTYSKTQLDVSNRFSDIGIGCMYGTMGLLYLDGRLAHQEGRIKTGLLGGEAMADSAILVQALKAIAGRQRPDAHGSKGKFWDGGSSFPSGHTIAAWSAASVLAHRYPHKSWVKIAAYGAASAISAARVTGKKHYPSDVAVGAVLGYLIGSHVSKRE
jgi:membrane-associated phospholipid phosphatase